MVRGTVRLALVVAALVAAPVSPAFIAAADDCGNYTGPDKATVYQPTYAELKEAFARAAANQLGPEYPSMPRLLAGYPDVRPSNLPMPCVILMAIAYIESTWQQAAKTPPGKTGQVITGFGGCGVGVMQVSLTERVQATIPRAIQLRIVNDYRYNIAHGARLLAEKWNTTPPIGSNDPTVIEHWYYAIWAYNSWSAINNPNNPAYPPNRRPYTGKENWRDYPYQELVFGLIANPPVVNGQRLWDPIPVNLPDRASIDPNPDSIEGPRVTHKAVCVIPTPGR
ncbi:MAG: hypothetical protein NZ518_10320 [Dehalococcoidia bacterium]|nr:hypothetical protein [Dehalococcoidia bacterium]